MEMHILSRNPKDFLFQIQSLCQPGNPEGNQGNRFCEKEKIALQSFYPRENQINSCSYDTGEHDQSTNDLDCIGHLFGCTWSFPGKVIKRHKGQDQEQAGCTDIMQLADQADLAIEGCREDHDSQEKDARPYGWDVDKL